jgi:hypothetical protein
MLVRKPEEKQQLGWLKRRCEDNIVSPYGVTAQNDIGIRQMVRT